MINEDYVSFEVAKLLKEKGFNEKCVAYYPQCITPIKLTFGGRVNYNASNKFKMSPPISAPTLQMAVKWLREKQIYIRIIEDAFGESYHFEVYSKNPNVKINYYVPNYYKDTYEDAVEAALKYCLENLI